MVPFRTQELEQALRASGHLAKPWSSPTIATVTGSSRFRQSS